MGQEGYSCSSRDGQEHCSPKKLKIAYRTSGWRFSCKPVNGSMDASGSWDGLRDGPGDVSPADDCPSCDVSRGMSADCPSCDVLRDGPRDVSLADDWDVLRDVSVNSSPCDGSPDSSRKGRPSRFQIASRRTPQ